MNKTNTTELIAVVAGEAYVELPDNLYIPPDALEVCLEEFEGPLDLLTYLIKQQSLNILDIPIRMITEQYVEYIEKMDELRMELAAEYLVMAAMLAEIKSSMLLPRHTSSSDEDEEDPRAELVRRLQEYERFKQAAEDIDQLPRLQRDNYLASADLVIDNEEKALPDVDIDLLLTAFKRVLQRVEAYSHHQIQRDELSVRDRMITIMQTLKQDMQQFFSIDVFFSQQEGRQGLVVSFLAILELSKEGLISIVQAEPLSEVWVKALE